MAEEQRVNLTDALVRDLPPAPAGKRVRIHDAKLPGFFVEVTDKGSKAFKYRKRIGRKVQTLTLDRFGTINTKEARRAAGKHAAAMAGGENPQDAKTAARGELSLQQLFNEYLQRHARPHKRTWQEDERQFKRYLSPMKARQLSTIKRRDIKALHVSIHDKAGPYAANRCLALLRCMFNKAAEWELFAGANPAAGIVKYKERSRDRFLQADELERFFKAVAAEENHTARDFILVCLLTGARRANVEAMRWEQVDLDGATWTIPDTKSGDPHTVPLVKAAVQLLKKRQKLLRKEAQDKAVAALEKRMKNEPRAEVTAAVRTLKADLKDAGDYPWVFPGPGKTGHLVEIKSAWARVLAEAGIEDLRIHDLRRTMGSWEAATGASLVIIGKSLAHKTHTATMVYSRLNIDPVRDAMEKAAGAMLSAAAGKAKPEKKRKPKGRKQ